MSKYGFCLDELKNLYRKCDDYLSNNELTCSEIDYYDRSLGSILNLLDAVINEDCESIEDNISNMELINLMKVNTEQLRGSYDIEIRNLICNKIANIDYTNQDVLFDKLNISDDEAIELVGDMINKYLGKNHYDIYKSFFKNMPSHVQFSDNYESLLNAGNCKDDSFVIVSNYDNICKATDLSHEAGHFYSLNIRGTDYYKDTVVDEVESTFYELLFINYLNEENIVSKNDVSSLFKSIIYNTVLKSSVLLNSQFSYPLYKVISVKEFKKMANSYNLYTKTGSQNSHELLDLMVTEDNKEFTYIYSTLVALQLFDKYNTSTNKIDAIMQYENLLKQIGCIPEYELVSTICKDYKTFDDFKVLRKYVKKIESGISY